MISASKHMIWAVVKLKLLSELESIKITDELDVVTTAKVSVCLRVSKSMRYVLVLQQRK